MVVFRRVVLMAAAAQALPAIWLATLQVEQGISPLALLKFLFTHDQRLDLAMTILSNGSSFFTFMTICTINALLCALALLLEKIVFTRLRATELQLSFQSSVNFVILRAMAIHAGVSLHEHDDQAWHWLFWAIVCGWGTALQAMSHARLTYLFTSPHADRVAVGKVLAVVVLAWATTLLVLSWTVAGPLHSVQWYLLWCFDFLMLTIKSANTLLTWLYYRQSIPATTTCEGHVVEERRYHSSLVIGLLLLLLRFLLCSSVLAINDFAIGPINIVAFFQCKGIVQSAQARLKAHGQYLLATRRLEQMFSVMSASLIPEHTRTAGCPICRDDFGDDACSLPCRHAFHQQQHHDGRADNDDNDYGDGGDGFWAFNQDDLEAEVARVLAVFPHAPAGAVRADVSVTGSAAATSNNILEGRVPAVALRSDTYRGGAPLQSWIDE
ncbi:hypothetical protein PTSG_09774 [Salpingoeca rosetta]|uniref:CUE domain-containing protein n=1 Tax=Salpingoeca rosetta (strain ATCC 50818 / BSB-021) TaxID=946362 RepID=F2UP08_SALR5|nr:uncharacterized protein PTSG_09774 [Salpingoeca rosetta]EGD79363.1 hypothetical protein PTSG_09774 [Salpingoeca rosetta]|eukprot:XP_004989132.1 hypothetical protein PTSG_09774 [Salpingoeca rosetta]